VIEYQALKTDEKELHLSLICNKSVSAGALSRTQLGKTPLGGLQRSLTSLAGFPDASAAGEGEGEMR